MTEKITMGDFSLCNTLHKDNESLLKDLGFSYVGENDELLAIYSGIDSVIVYNYDYGIMIEYWHMGGKRDEFLMSLVDGDNDEKFPEVMSQVYTTVAEMLECQ